MNEIGAHVAAQEKNWAEATARMTEEAKRREDEITDRAEKHQAVLKVRLLPLSEIISILAVVIAINIAMNIT